MSSVLEIEKALGQLHREDRWEIARWLLEDLHESARGKGSEFNGRTSQTLPDYSARRRRIFGTKVLPNMVLAARSTDKII